MFVTVEKVFFFRFEKGLVISQHFRILKNFHQRIWNFIQICRNLLTEITWKFVLVKVQKEQIIYPVNIKMGKAELKFMRNLGGLSCESSFDYCFKSYHQWLFVPECKKLTISIIESFRLRKAPFMHQNVGKDLYRCYLYQNNEFTQRFGSCWKICWFHKTGKL